MTLVLAIAVALIAVMLALVVGAQVELFEQVKQVRRYLELEDKIDPITLDAALRRVRPSAVGLPGLFDGVPMGLVLVLSNRCAACRAIAESIGEKGLPEAIWIMVVPVSGDGSDIVDALDIAQPHRVFVDAGHAISTELGLEITPAALQIEEGRIVGTHTVPSVRQFGATAAAIDRGEFLTPPTEPILTSESVVHSAQL